jgi:hypothetical protein
LQYLDAPLLTQLSVQVGGIFEYGTIVLVHVYSPRSRNR